MTFLSHSGLLTLSAAYKGEFDLECNEIPEHESTGLSWLIVLLDLLPSVSILDILMEVGTTRRCRHEPAIHGLWNFGILVYPRAMELNLQSLGLRIVADRPYVA